MNNERVPSTELLADLIAAIRADIKANLRDEILAELQPEIERRLYSNIFDTKEASNYLKVSDSTLRRMVKQDGLPFFKQRGQMFFRQIALNDWIRKREGATR